MNSAFHKLQAEGMIKILNNRDLNAVERLERDYVLTLAHALLATVPDDIGEAGED